jgi:hypothetical protein
MKNTHLVLSLAIALACTAPLSLLHADEMNDLISTVMQASTEVKAKAQAYQHPSKKASSSAKSTSSGRSSTGVPDMQIPDSEVLEVASKFPRNYMGKYVYGTVTAGHGGEVFAGSPALIGFWAKNMRCFYLETMDQRIIDKLNQYPYGTKFVIPRECPLKIVQKCGFNYIVHLPFESPTPNQ